MPATLLARAARGTLAITPLTREKFAAWRDAQDSRGRNWVAGQGFTGAEGQICVLSDNEGRPSAVAFGLDEAAPFWSYAALPANLPAGSYRLAPPLAPPRAEIAALGWLVGSYRFERYRQGPGKDFPRLVKPAKADRTRVEALAAGIHLTRDLINTPANDMGPAELAKAARTLARRFNGRVSLVTGKALLDKNFPLIHAVGRASATAPRLIDLRWGRSGPKVTLVGKGVCFDSGGLDLKSASGMLTMKKDMGGAAHVLGLAEAVMASGLKLQLRVLIPAVENAVSGNAFRPLDILKSRQGRTVEIGNTDAEGRLVLADALSLACEEKPSLILDFATLTGAARVALGTELPALFANHDETAETFLSQGRSLGDPLWRLPLHQPYRRLLDSKIADINNVSSGGYGGAITAALFLESFIDRTSPWLHVDLMAWNLAGRPGRPEGGEAMGLRAAYGLLSRLAG